MTGARAFGAVIADADPQLSGHERRVLRVLNAWPPGRTLTLDNLAEAAYPGSGYARRHVFAAVASLEDIGYLERGEIR